PFDQLVGQRIQPLLRQGRRRLANRGGAIRYAKKACVLTRASTKRSASSSVLYRAKEARALEETPYRAIRGPTHCVPALTATSSRSRICATSCAWAPSTVKERIAPFPGASPSTRSQLAPFSLSRTRA